MDFGHLTPTTAVSFDSSLMEANRRLSGFNRQITSGNIGESIRNKIQLCNTWAKLLDEAITFYSRNPYINLVVRTVPQYFRQIANCSLLILYC